MRAVAAALATPLGYGTIRTTRCLGQNRSRGAEGNAYTPRISHRWSSTSIAPAIRSMPAGLQRIRELRHANRSSDEPQVGRGPNASDGSKKVSFWDGRKRFELLHYPLRRPYVDGITSAPTMSRRSAWTNMIIGRGYANR
jgi:hypothetical protein